MSRIQRALEAAGVIFIEGNGDGPGVKLRKGKSARKKEGARPYASKQMARDTGTGTKPPPKSKARTRTRK
jgi:hypothetical protein